MTILDISQVSELQSALDQANREIVYLRDKIAYYEREDTWLTHLMAVPSDTLGPGEKITEWGLRRHLQEDNPPKNEEGYALIEPWKIARRTGQYPGTVNDKINYFSTVRQNGKPDKPARLPLCDKRIATGDDRHNISYLKPAELFDYPVHYNHEMAPANKRKQGGPGCNQGRKKCQRCGRDLKITQRIIKTQTIESCPHCHTSTTYPVQDINVALPVSRDVEVEVLDKPQTNQVDLHDAATLVEPVEQDVEPDAEYEMEVTQERERDQENQVDLDDTHDAAVAQDEQVDSVIPIDISGQLARHEDEDENQVDLDDVDGSDGDVERRDVNTGVCTASLPYPPLDLEPLKQWVVWRYEIDEDHPDGKQKKVPYQTKGTNPQKASTSDKTTWASYAEAKKRFDDSQAWKRPYDGIGFVFNNDFTGIDFDHCITYSADGTMHIDAHVWEQVQAIQSYTEISPSGTGLKVFARGTIDKGRKLPSIEMYSAGRYFTFTGKWIPGTPTQVEDRQEEITALYKSITPVANCSLHPEPKTEAHYSVLSEPKTDLKYTLNLALDGEQPADSPTCVYEKSSDETIMAKAYKYDNGKFSSLWNGDMSYIAQHYPRLDGSPDHSRADQALCRILAYWSDNDAQAVDRLFRQSRLMREKWERPDYHESTIKRAMEGNQCQK